MGYKEIAAKFLEFATLVIQYCRDHNKDQIDKHISIQLIRAATSCGANYEEARGAESRPDFLHKMQVVLKEARESLYWIKLIREFDKSEDGRIDDLFSKAEELVKIMSKSVASAKKNDLQNMKSYQI